MADEQIPRIFLIEPVDDRRVLYQIAVTNTLKSMGVSAQIQTAKGAEDALARLARAPSPNSYIIISNFVMPGMNGAQLYANLTPELQRRILFFTGAPELVAQEIGAMKPGAILPPVISKPTDTDALGKALSAYVPIPQTVDA